MSITQEHDKQVLETNRQLVEDFTQKHFAEEEKNFSVEKAMGGSGIDVLVRIGIASIEQDAHTYMRNTNRVQSFLLAIATKFSIPMKTILITVEDTETRFRFTI